MKISVVLTTYNGEKYLMPQLQSIAEQSVPADEVLIFDDGSKDSTCSLVNGFIEENGLSAWSLIVNEKNKGWQRNFMEGIAQACGDIVLLADQDDIWHTDKIRVMRSVFEKEPDAELVVCAYEKFRDEAVPALDIAVSGAYHKQVSKAKNCNIIYPGCTFAFRKIFFDRIKAGWSEKYPHDALIYMAGWVHESIYVCEDVLHFFRRHEGSASLAGADFSKKSRLARIERQITAYRALTAEGSALALHRHAVRYGKWLSLRLRLLKDRSFLAGVQLLKYIFYYGSIKTWALDFFVGMKKGDV